MALSPFLVSSKVHSSIVCKIKSGGGGVDFFLSVRGKYTLIS